MLVFKAEELKKHKTSKSFNQTNRDSYLILHKKNFTLSICIQKIKDTKEQKPNKLIEFENNKFKDFACVI